MPVTRLSLIVSTKYTRAAYDKGARAALAGKDRAVAILAHETRNYMHDDYDGDAVEAWEAGYDDNNAPLIVTPIQGVPVEVVEVAPYVMPTRPELVEFIAANLASTDSAIVARVSDALIILGAIDRDTDQETAADYAPVESAPVQVAPVTPAPVTRDSWALSVCTDCTLEHANGESSYDQTNGQPAPWALYEGTHVGMIAMGGEPCEYDCPAGECECDQLGFCHSRCDACGTRLAGDRFRFTEFA